MRLLNLDPRRLPVGRAAAGFLPFSLSHEKIEEWVDERRRFQQWHVEGSEEERMGEKGRKNTRGIEERWFSEPAGAVGICLPAESTDKSRSQTGFFIKNVFQKHRGKKKRRGKDIG